MTTTTTTTTTTSTTTTTTVPWYLASSYNIDVGNLDSGLLSDTYTDNGVHLVIEEVTGNPGYETIFYFEGLPVEMTSFDIHLKGYYQGNPAHTVKARKYNHTLDQYDDFTADSTDFPSRSTDDDYTFSSANIDYVSGQQFRFKVIHNFNGTPTHHFHIDYLWIENTVLPSNDPEIIFKYKDQNRTFKRDIINKAFKRATIQKVFKYQLKTSVKS